MGRPIWCTPTTLALTYVPNHSHACTGGAGPGSAGVGAAGPRVQLYAARHKEAASAAALKQSVYSRAAEAEASASAAAGGGVTAADASRQRGPTMQAAGGGRGEASAQPGHTMVAPAATSSSSSTNRLINQLASRAEEAQRLLQSLNVKH